MFLENMSDPRKVIKERLQDIKDFLKNPSDFNKRQNKITLVRLGFAVIYINFIFMLIQLTYVIYSLRVDRLWLNPIYGIITILAPFALWVYSTLFEEFNYKKNKKNKFILCVLNAILVIIRYSAEPFGLLIIPYCWKIKIDDEIFTRNMVVYLARFLLIVSLILVYSIFQTNLLSVIFSEEFIVSIGNFKLQHYVDFREDKEYKYDLNIMHNLETGAEFVIHENDRYTHIAAIGASGTAKTSSALLPTVYGDIKIKLCNREARTKAIYNFIKDGKGRLAGTPGPDVKCKDVQSKKKYVEELKKIERKYQDIGYCVISPNNDLTNKVYDMCVANNIKCSVIDPSLKEDGSLHEGFSSINPLYVSETIPENQIPDVISDKATKFADVIQRITDLRGKPDGYFTGINRTCTINISILVMCAYHYSKETWHEQPTMIDVLNGLTDFKQLEVYVNIIEEHFRGNGARNDNYLETNPFFPVTSYVRRIFLGESKEKISDHATGLKNVLQEIINSPRMRRIFGNTNPIDFDRVLAESEFVVMNFALDIGDSLSTTLGLFCVETLDQAIKRRPGTEEDRQPFVLMIDELARILTPSIETGFTLYRQYKISMFVAYQDNSQFERLEATKMIPKVIQTLGTNIVYGRVGTDMMKTYEELSGKDRSITTQKTISQTSMLDASPTYSMSERDTPDEQAVVSGSDLRYRDFQEVTVYTTRDNRVLKPVVCKLHFLPKDAYVHHEEQKLDWDAVAEEDFIDDSLCLGVNRVDSPMEKLEDEEEYNNRELSKSIVVNADNGQTVSVNTTATASSVKPGQNNDLRDAERTESPAKVETSSPTPVVDKNEDNSHDDESSGTEPASRFGKVLTGQDLAEKFTS